MSSRPETTGAPENFLEAYERPSPTRRRPPRLLEPHERPSPTIRRRPAPVSKVAAPVRPVAPPPAAPPVASPASTPPGLAVAAPAATPRVVPAVAAADTIAPPAPALDTISPAADSPAGVAASTSGGDRVGLRLVLRGGLWSAASQLLPSFGVAVLSVVAARVLGTNALGRQSLIAYVNSAAAATFVTGLGSAGLQVMGRLKGAQDGRLNELGAWLVRTHLLVGAALCGAMAGIGLGLGRDQFAWVLIGIVTVIDSVVSGLAVRVAVRQGWVEVGKLQLVSQLLGAPLGIAALAIGLGIAGIFAGDGIAALLLLLVMLARFGSSFPRPAHRWRLRPPVPMARAWGLFTLSNLLFQVVGRRVEFLALAVFSTDRQIALYSVAFMLVSLLATVPSSVASAALPVIAAAAGRGEMHSATEHMRHAVRLGTTLCIPLVAFAAALGPVVIEMIYGRAYREAAGLVPLASVVLLFAVSGGVLSQYWAGRGDVALTLKTGSIAGVVDLGLAFALVPNLGARGAIIANLIGQLVSVGGLLFVTVRRTGSLRFSTFYGARITAASAAGGVVAWRLSRAVTGHVGGPHLAVDLAALVAGAAVGVPVVIALASVLKVVSPAEEQWLRTLLPTRLKPLLRALTGTHPHPR